MLEILDQVLCGVGWLRVSIALGVGLFLVSSSLLYAAIMKGRHGQRYSVRRAILGDDDNDLGIPVVLGGGLVVVFLLSWLTFDGAPAGCAPLNRSQQAEAATLVLALH